MDHREKVSTQGPGLRGATSELTTRKNLIAQKYVPDRDHNKDKILEAREKVYGRLKEKNKINLVRPQPRGWLEMGSWAGEVNGASEAPPGLNFIPRVLRSI